MGRRRIYFRADGNSQTGLGHVSRCCALSQILNNDFNCNFIIRNPSQEISKVIIESGSKIVEPNDSVDILDESRELSKIVDTNDIIVLDGYSFSTEYQNILKATGCLLVCIDDIYSYHFVCDVIINHAGDIMPSLYSREYYTQLYLGPEYAMLKLPFYFSRYRKKRKASDKNVLISMGGADPNNETIKVLEQCYLAKPNYSYYVVIGSAYSYSEQLKNFLENKKDLSATIYKNIQAEALVELMSECQTAITTPSTMAYEYLFTGGFLYLNIIADNQLNMYRYLIEHKLAKHYENFLLQEQNHELNEEVNLNHDFVNNLRNIFLRLDIEIKLKISNASIININQFFKWVNDPLVRSQSYTSTPILWESHESWYRRKLNDENHRMYVFTLGEDPVGQIRFEIENYTAVLSYLIDEKYRGKGLGVIVLKKGIMALVGENKHIERIIGFVKKNNVPSSKAFNKMGFKEEETHKYPDSFMYVLNL